MLFLRRVSPAILLFFLSPLVAEFVLGDLGFAEIGALFALAPLYGGGAILIREVVRRSRRGWPTFLLLALAYALLEEGLLTQSLFNPNYLHLRLIDYGFVPALGTGLPWAIFVLTIHVVWSLAVPIGLVEAAFHGRGSEPWLKIPGLIITAGLLGLGAWLVMHFSLGQTPFRASPLQIGICAFLILASVAVAFLGFPARRATSPEPTRAAVQPLIIAAVGFIGGSAFQLSHSLGEQHLPWPATTALLLFIIVCAVAFSAWAVRARNWTALHVWSAAFGGLLCYCWVGYTVDRALHGPGHALAHSVFVAVALGIAAWGGLRARRDGSSAQDAPQFAGDLAAA